jgi:hypothetical protein
MGHTVVFAAVLVVALQLTMWWDTMMIACTRYGHTGTNKSIAMRANRIANPYILYRLSGKIIKSHGRYNRPPFP